MDVIKRDGRKEKASLDKVTRRAEALADGLKVEPIAVAQRVVSGLYDGIKVTEIDVFLAETAASLATEHPDYAKLAARVMVSSLQKETSGYATATRKLSEIGILSDTYVDFVAKNQFALEDMIDYKRDYQFDYFGYKTLERSYLLKVKGVVVERPQDMFMRVAVAVAGDNLAEIRELYNLLSLGYYTHATPTLFNAGCKMQQLSSCFLLAMQEDSINGIYDTLKDCALISKSAGGIGLHIHNIRATGAPIIGTNGVSNGIVPMLKVFNETARYVDQGGGKRKGSFAVYLEPWHADIESFLDLRKNHGKEEFRARDLFLALWVPDLFMERVENDAEWTLFSPHNTKGLSDLYGAEFTQKYQEYERMGLGVKTIKARQLMTQIIESQAETGTPYMLYKDACNEKSNQKNLGTIKSSNLCAEIMEVSTPDETAACNLASMALPKFVTDTGFDFDKLHQVTKVAIKNLDRVIDVNYHPTDKIEKSNHAHRPVGLGIQGLADVFFKMHLPFDSEEALQLNRDIAETMYHASLEASCEIAAQKGAYSSYDGSPISHGHFQFDLWDEQPSSRWDWSQLKRQIAEHGVRNSLLIAQMPTASTAQILGNNEAFEAQTSNIYKRQTLSGEFIIINKHLVSDLEQRGLWTSKIRDAIILNNGSVQGIDAIPDDLQSVYRTVWEISQKVIIDMSAERAPFVCQSQSLNLWLASPTFAQINAMHFYAWKRGLKTGMYYLRSKPSTNAVKVTVGQQSEDEDCLNCGA
ncbi:MULTISPECIES: ribonucleoside-diphosphate reductase subunit alpha [unclassified Vibrio]|uniref:ribonucleoside-diphosphate reductase subunit alpha n=1 Tax=unclassified Vibrio TaxID=2614977 RepID=UPI0025535E99|nr:MULTISPECIES: ribonucleoside-diphosphate reductase subunit alpha [unclassified Vibrio]MDK9778573.1 ribonucleoside-diphosphate reductase subunit alpha [Vibrio sp. D401a]MDK9803678.1 ribonucleoside-diphosphate reductase subunit alpha [Vibrio sp. D406a]